MALLVLALFETFSSYFLPPFKMFSPLDLEDTSVTWLFCTLWSSFLDLLKSPLLDSFSPHLCSRCQSLYYSFPFHFIVEYERERERDTYIDRIILSLLSYIFRQIILFWTSQLLNLLNCTILLLTNVNKTVLLKI